MRESFDIVGEYSISRSLEYDAGDVINLYVVMDQDGVKPESLQPLPGVQQSFTVPGNGAIRDNGLFAFNGTGYGVSDENVFKFNANGGVTILGALATTTGYISWANSPNEIAIVDGLNLYSYTISTNTFAQVTAISTANGFPPNPQMIYYQDARFILSFRDSASYYYSDFADSTTGALQKWDSTYTFAQISRPDISRGISGSNERLYLFGGISAEVWGPTQNSNLLPFIRDNNFIFEFGLGAQGSIVKGVVQSQRGGSVINFVYWLSTNPNGLGTFVITTGGVPIKISSEAIDIRLRSYPRIDDCISFAYTESGHIFIENNFPTANETLVYDLTTNMWFRKMRADGSRSLINSHAFVDHKHFVGSRLTPNVYQLSQDYLSDGDDVMIRRRVSKTFKDPLYRRIFGKRVEVDFESGQVPEGVTPYAFLSVSYDGGRTYGNPIRMEMGKIGEYRWRSIWFMLGQALSFTFRIDTYDDVRFYVLGMTFDYELSDV